MSANIQVAYESNPNQRTPCVLVLDASGSMMERGVEGKTRIEQLNAGMRVLEEELKKDDVAQGRVQLSIVCVGGPTGGAEVLMDWTDVAYFSSFDLVADNQTPLAEGLLLALQLVEDGKRDLRANGISYTRPWIMVITDGAPTDSDERWTQAASECRQAISERKCVIYPIGVEGADLGRLAQISDQPPLSLTGLKFSELFVWLSKSMSTVSKSAPGATVNLPSVAQWASAPT